MKGLSSLLILIALLHGFHRSYAQSSYYTITGQAMGNDAAPVPNGNVIALNPLDSSILKGDYFLEGSFRLNNIADSIILLKLTATGYSSYYQLLRRPATDSILNIGIVTLEKGNHLDEVEVTARVPLFENDGEKVKINVENTILSAVSTALDVLRRSPGVIVTTNDNITVFGKGQPLIYLDGQLLTSIEVLKSLPAADIKHIEIIRNPSARYDASGRAVINIVTKKSNLQGFNGNLINNTAYGRVFGNYAGLRLNARKGKWMGNLSYGNFQGYDWNSDLYDRSFVANDTTIHMHNYIFHKNKFANSHFYRFSGSYNLDSNTTISAAYYGFYKKNLDVSANENSITRNDLPYYKLTTATNNEPFQLNHNANFNYIRKLDTLGSEFFAAVQYGNYSSEATAHITQNTEYNNISYEQQKRNYNNSGIQLFTFQSDLTKHFKKHFTLEAGVKESYVVKSGELKFDNLSNGLWIPDNSYYSGYDFKENITAAYAQGRYKKNGLNIRAGLRSEHTDTYGYSRKLDSTIVNRHYINLFPSAFIGYNFNKHITASLNYSSRIRRPTYQDMDPFINYIDSLSSFRGNPYLKPEYTSSFEANLVYDKEVTLLTFGYNRTRGAMNLVVDKLNDGSNAFIGITKNLNYSESFSIGTTIPYENKWLTTATYFGYFWNTFNYNQSGTVINNARPMFYVYVYDELRFKNWFSLQIEGEYTGAGADGMFTFNPFYYMNVLLQKKFLKNKLVCRAGVNDIFKTYRNWGGSNIPGFDVKYYSLMNTFHYIVMLNYSFGKMSSQQQRNRSINQEEYNRIKMGK